MLKEIRLYNCSVLLHHRNYHSQTQTVLSFQKQSVRIKRPRICNRYLFLVSDIQAQAQTLHKSRVSLREEQKTQGTLRSSQRWLEEELGVGRKDKPRERKGFKRKKRRKRKKKKRKRKPKTLGLVNLLFTQFFKRFVITSFCVNRFDGSELKVTDS